MRMRAVILNSGLGSRMGALTRNAPKCFAPLTGGECILERQIRLLLECGIDDILITTGPFPGMIQRLVEEKFPQLEARFVENARYADTNYIYSMYLASAYLEEDILLMHGDLVFEAGVLNDVIQSSRSCMVCDRSLPLPEKDFKAVAPESRIEKIGVNFFDNACAAQPLYKLFKSDMRIWLDRIVQFCESGNLKVYAENALNEVSDQCEIYLFDAAGRLCTEVDTGEDLQRVNDRLLSLQRGKQNGWAVL